jgi:hypothetical protein
MLVKLLSYLFFVYKQIFTPRDYSIISEELEYGIDHDMKYNVEDNFWLKESKSWDDGILDEYYVNVTGKNFRHTIIPQNVKWCVLRVRYYYNGKEYTGISTNINFKPGEHEDMNMHFSIPLSSVWLSDHDDKPQRDITDKVKRYSGPRNDFHGQTVPIEYFLYYDKTILEDQYPKMVLNSTLGIKKSIKTIGGFTNQIRLP